MSQPIVPFLVWANQEMFYGGAQVSMLDVNGGRAYTHTVWRDGEPTAVELKQVLTTAVQIGRVDRVFSQVVRDEADPVKYYKNLARYRFAGLPITRHPCTYALDDLNQLYRLNWDDEEDKIHLTVMPDNVLLDWGDGSVHIAGIASVLFNSAADLEAAMHVLSSLSRSEFAHTASAAVGPVSGVKTFLENISRKYSNENDWLGQQMRDAWPERSGAELAALLYTLSASL